MKPRQRQNDRFKQRRGMALFNQLQIESRKDLNKKVAINIQDDNIDCIPQLSWDLINEQVDQQKIITNYKEINSQPKLAKIEQVQNLKARSQFQQSKVLAWDPSQVHDEMQASNQYGEYPNKTNQKCGSENREIQILERKQLSNYQYMRTQINQMLKLITCIMMFEDQSQLKNRISELSAKVRRIRLKSLSCKKIQNKYASQYYDKQTKKMEQMLSAQLRNTKIKSNKLGTKLLLMDNYLRATQKPKQQISKRSRNKYNIKSQYNLDNISLEPQQDNYNIKRLKSSNSHRNLYLRLKSERKLQLISKSPSHSNLNTKVNNYDQNEQMSLLREYRSMVKNNIQNTIQYVSSKQECLRNEHANLKQQIEMVQLKIQKLNAYNRRMRSSSQSLKNKQSLAAFTLKSIKSQRNLIKNRKNQLKQQQVPASHSLSLTSKTIKMQQKNMKNIGQLNNQIQNNNNAQKNQKQILPSQSIINSLAKQQSEQLIKHQEQHLENYKNIRCEYYEQAMHF